MSSNFFRDLFKDATIQNYTINNNGIDYAIKLQIPNKLRSIKQRPIQVWIDEASVQQIFVPPYLPGKVFIQELDLGIDNLKLICCGNKADLLWDGQLLHYRQPYPSVRSTSLWYRILLIILNIASVSIVPLLNQIFNHSVGFHLFNGLVLILCGIGLSIQNASSPFYNIKQKYMYSLLPTALIWVAVALLACDYTKLILHFGI